MVCTMLASPSSSAAQHRAVARGDRERQADREPERQRGDADAHVVAEIVRQLRERLAQRGSENRLMPRRPAAAARRAARPAGAACAAARRRRRRRCRQQLRRRALRQQRPPRITAMRSASSMRLRHVVGDHHGGQAELVVQRAIVVAERVAGERIERAERLVHQHDARLRRRARARRRRAGAAPPDSSCGKAVAILRAVEPHQVEQFVDARGDSAAASQPSSFGVMAMFSATVMCGNSPPLWNT